MPKKITIYNLAQELGLSAGTVSRSLNDHPSISDATKKRVVDKAREMGYRLNKFAANLSRQRSNTIGIIVPKLNSFFMSSILAGIETVANKEGYNIIISQSLESEEKEKLNAQTLYDSGVDALLISLAFDTKNYDHLNNFISQKIPLLFFDRVQHIANCPAVQIDNELAGFEATSHLIGQGCKHLMHISGPLERNVYTDRYRGFTRALQHAGLNTKGTQLLQTRLKREEVENVVEHIANAKQPIDGIFVANDNFAAHLIKQLKRKGYSIPKQIKIIGFNDDPIAQVVEPSLTTISHPGYEMGVVSGQSIINHLKGNMDLAPTNSIILRHKLIVRESSQHKKT